MSIQVESAYEAAASDPDFTQVMRRCAARSDSDDERLADLIEADGRWRLRKGRPVTLERYMAAIPGLADRSNVLDAALEVTLRGMSGSSRIAPHAADELAARHPSLNQAIREAATLNAALWSTTGLRERLSPRPVRALPCDFGSAMTDGRRRYMLHELLGQGSFGQVYRAEDRQLSEEGHPAIVAIKILSVPDRSEHDRHRMIEEATKARRISHPNVVQVLDRGAGDEDEDFIVYEFVGGGDLSTRCAGRLPMTSAEAATLMAQVARGVHAAHAAGVIHCDLKPSNVMLTPDGQPKVADFGIAVRVGDDRRALLAATEYARGPVGNIAFISPEQFRCEDGGFSVPSDVYALGGILYFLLTGELPNGSTREAIVRTHDAAGGRTIAPSPRNLQAQVDSDLDAICRRALSPRPNARHDSAAAFAEDLERWCGHEPIAWLKPKVLRRSILWAKRKPALAATTGAIVLVALIGLATASYFARDAAKAQMQVDINAAVSKNQAEFFDRVRANLTNLGPQQRFSTDMLMQVWIYEYLYGPLALDQPDRVAKVWEARIAGLRKILTQRSERRLNGTLESLLWEAALAFWLISDGEHREALPLIERNFAAWQAMLATTDPWLSEMATLKRCAETNAALDPGFVGIDASDRRARLESLDHALTEARQHLELEHPRSPLHYLVIRRLIDINGDRGLNDIARVASLKSDFEWWLNKETQANSGGIAKQGREEKAANDKALAPIKQP